MLYDTTADVIRKALRGLDLAPSTAAARCGLPEREVVASARGPASKETLLRLAPALGLHGPALAGLPGYAPPPSCCPQITRLELPFDDETVNAWLIQAGPGEFALFDTGQDPGDLAKALDLAGATGVHVFITHDHRDHTGGLDGLGGRALSREAPFFPDPIRPGDVRRLGGLEIQAISLPGHCDGALGYVIGGLSRKLCVTGDALFAGSIGGCAPGKPYREALAALHVRVMQLESDTILLPGHGPETTVASEATGNPFVATVQNDLTPRQ